jgi:hypothetical protein
MARARGASDQYPHSYYDPFYADPYYDGMYSSGGAAGSSSMSTDLYPSVNRRGPPSRPPPPATSTSTIRDRSERSPPRKQARQNDDRSNDTRRGTFIERGGKAGADDREIDRVPSRSAAAPKLEPAIEAFIEACKAQQDARRERYDVEASNAKYLKYKDREDISKENKAKAELAADEIKEAKRKDEMAWRAVEKQTKEMLIAALGQERKSDTLTTRMIVPQPVTPPRQLSRQQTTESELEPGELRVPKTTQPSQPAVAASHPGPPLARPPPGLAVSSAPAPNVSVDPAAPASKGKVKETVTRASIMDKFEDLDLSLMNIKSETDERLYQMESLMQELIQEEVEVRLRKAREAWKAKYGADKGQEKEKNDSSNGETQSALATASSGPNTDAARQVVPPAPVVTASASTGRLLREEPGMSHEQVTALLESMRQSMREEYDAKLLQQERAHQEKIDHLNYQVAAQFRKDQESVVSGLNSHYGVLSSHQDLLNRHEQLWQGTLGLFGSVPKPTNTP